MSARILVADGNKTTRELIATVLAREGFEVLAAADAFAVQARIRESPPALVIASAALPGGAPIELCRAVRESAGAAVRILLLVATGDLEGATPAALATRLGCDAVMIRPFRYSAAREQMSTWGLAVERKKEPRQAAVSFSVPVAPPAVFDVSTIAAPEPPVDAGAGQPGEGGRWGAQPPGATEGAADAVAGTSATSAAVLPVIALGAPLDPSVLAALQSFVPPPEPVPVAPAPGDESAAKADAATSGEQAAELSDEIELEDEIPLEDLLAGTELAAGPGASAGVATAATTVAPASAATPAASSSASASTAQPADHAARAAAAPDGGAGSSPASPLPSAPIVASPLGRESFFGRSALPAQPATAHLATPAAAPARAAVATERAPSAAQVVATPAQPRKPAALPSTLPAAGKLEEVPLPRILFELYAATFSGKVLLSRQGVGRTLYVWNGLPVRVDSDQIEESIGRLLVEHGRITPEQHEAALALATERRSSEVEALLAGGAIKDSELVDILREQTEKRLVHSFAWRDGAYRIEADAQFGESMVLTEVHPLQAIWRGVSEHYDLASLMTYFGALRDCYVVATALFEVHCERLGPFLRKLDIAALLGGKTTFLGALRSDDTRALEIAQALYVLLVTDMVRASRAPGEPVVLPAPGEDEPSMSAPVDYRAITRLCDEVNREYLRVKESDFFDALRVEQDAAPAAVDAAYANIVRPFTLEALPPGLPEDVQRRASELCAALSRARATLRDPAQRERYIEAMRARYTGADGKPAGEARPGGPSFVTDVDLDVDRGADQDRETRQLAERAYVEGSRLAKSGDLELAQQKLAVAVRLNTREPGYRVALARAVLAAAEGDHGHRREAAALLQQALQLDPSHVDANFELARLLVEVGQAPAARPYLMRVLQRAPEHREARALMGKLAG